MISKFELILLLLSTTFVLARSLSTTQGQGSCGPAPPVSGASVETVRDVATYTCNTGYIMKGLPSNVTCINSTWEGEPPKCIPTGKSISMRSEPKVFNHIHNQGVPFWLLVVIGIVGGCAALLLLCCTLAVCLKCFGIVVPVNKDERENGIFSYHACCCCRKTIQVKDESETPKEIPNEKRMKKVSISSVYPPDYNVLHVEKKDAKKPTKTWMPHQNEVRSYNTSTK